MNRTFHLYFAIAMLITGRLQASFSCFRDTCFAALKRRTGFLS